MKPAATTREERLLIDGRLVAADAVAIANNSAYGLSGMVVSPSAERARRVAERVRTGTISVNGGRESGLAGFEEYLEIKTIALGLT
jgi:aldehyde dehydrogenase (NAD+)